MDQYLAVLDPLEYNAKVTKGASRKLISLVLVLGISAAAIASCQLIWASEHSPWISCREAFTTAAIQSTSKETEFHQGRIWLGMLKTGRKYIDSINFGSQAFKAKF